MLDILLAIANICLAKDYYIDGQNTQLIFFEKMTNEGVKMPTQITLRKFDLGN